MPSPSRTACSIASLLPSSIRILGIAPYFSNNPSTSMRVPDPGSRIRNGSFATSSKQSRPRRVSGWSARA